MKKTENIIFELRKSKAFVEGYNTLVNGCQCEKCKISRYRHTHDPTLADPLHTFWDYLKFCIAQADIKGLWLEFGVGSGKTLSFIAQQKPDQVIYGFDSFKGLPEDWRIDDDTIYRQSKYSLNGIAPSLPHKNITLVNGYFNETLEQFVKCNNEPCSFIHIDCDLYSSTIYVLMILFNAGKIIKGTVILFDELYNYKYYEQHEFRALNEFLQNTGIKYAWIAHTESPVSWNGNQAALIVM